MGKDEERARRAEELRIAQEEDAEIRQKEQEEKLRREEKGLSNWVDNFIGMSRERFAEKLVSDSELAQQPAPQHYLYDAGEEVRAACERLMLETTDGHRTHFSTRLRVHAVFRNDNPRLRELY